MRILLTRPAGRNEKLAERLREDGHHVTCAPLIELEPLSDEPVDLDGYDWVLVTSVMGARELRRRGRGRPKRFAAIGPATAEALGGADLVPRLSTQEGLLNELPKPAGRVLFAGAEAARRLLVDELGADFVALYRTRQLALELPQADLVVLTSPSAARAYAALHGRAPVVSIGPETTSAAQAAGLDVAREAASADVDALADAVDAATR